MKIEFHSLLHLAVGESSAMNAKVANFEKQVLLYLENAVTLSNSLDRIGAKLILLTNQKELIDGILFKHGYALEVREIPFVTKVPSGVRFYSAHFKFDAIRYLATLTEIDYLVFCDSDVVCINDASLAFKNNALNGIPMYYDISEQTPQSAVEKNIIDLKLLLGADNDGRWAGGEFLAGPPGFFGQIANELDFFYSKYVKNIHFFGHVGDEMVMSAILEKLRRNGVNMVNAGTIGIIGRYWSGDLRHVQNHFNYYRSLMLLHLPSDKVFLASLASDAKSQPDILRKYDVYRKSPVFVFKKALRAIRKFSKRNSAK